MKYAKHNYGILIKETVPSMVTTLNGFQTPLELIG